MEATANELLRWEETYIKATKVVTDWLHKAGDPKCSITSTTQESEAWIREAAALAYTLKNKLPAAEMTQWRKGILTRKKMLDYWKARIEPWDVQRKEWDTRHRNFLRACVK